MSSIQFYDVMITMDGKVSTTLEDEYFLFCRQDEVQTVAMDHGCLLVLG